MFIVSFSMYKVLLHNAISAENVHTPNITSTLDEIILKMKVVSWTNPKCSASSCTEKQRRSQVAIVCFKVMYPCVGLIGSLVPIHHYFFVVQKNSLQNIINK